MGEIFKNSYFFQLPNEVLIKILSDIDILSQLNFCEVYGCDYFLQDRNIIRTIDLQKKYIFHDLNQLSRKINHKYVTTLNVNGLYWVQPSKLRVFVSKLVNLETLYAIQSNLSLTQDDVEVYSKMKIKKLGISIIRNDQIGFTKLPTVETLYISVVHWSHLAHSLLMDTVFPNIKKIWISVEGASGQRFLHTVNGESKLKIYVQKNVPLPPISFDHYGISTFYTNLRPNQHYAMCCERFNGTEKPPAIAFNSGGWRVLEELHYSKPFGPRDARRLYLNGNRLDGIFFEELNFAHDGPVCNQRCREAIREILVSTNAQRSRKLCMMTCLLQDEQAGEPNYAENSNGFKRKRLGVETSKTSISAQNIFSNFPQLEELAIFVCTETNHRSAIQGLPLISSFENLQSLIIEIPLTSNGNFLSDVFLKCKGLRVVKVFSRSQNEKLDLQLCNSVANATSVKDFVYENHRIHLDRLLEQLATIKSQNLQRILLNCQEVDKFSEGTFKKFMEANPQLIFLYFAISNLTVAAQRMAQNSVTVYKKNHPAKAFFVKKGKQEFERSRYPIPDVHYNEMMSSNIGIATLNALEDFEFF